MIVSKPAQPVYLEVAHPEIVSLENFYPVIDHVVFAKDNGDVAVIIQPDFCIVHRAMTKPII